MASHAPSASVRSKQLAVVAYQPSGALVLTLVSAFAFTILLVFAIPLDLTDGSGVLATALLAAVIVLVLTPPLIRKMKAGGMIGFDVNKAGRVQVAELGGIAALFAFSVSLSFIIGLQKLLGNVAEPPFLAAISVFFMASMIGLIDDISDLKQRFKALAVAFAALPLMLVHLGSPVIDLPLGLQFDLSGPLHLFYWLILVPIGVTGVANAMNMSAGYNGLETGQIAVIAASMIMVGQLRGLPDVALLVFAGLLGCSLSLYYYNKFPAKVFVGDIGTLGLGAALAAGMVLGHIEFYGLIAIAPAFYEGAATAYYGIRRQNGQRKAACRHPIILPDGRLACPEGAAHFTLAYLILSKHPMTEKKLVRTILSLYLVSGATALLLSVI